VKKEEEEEEEEEWEIYIVMLPYKDLFFLPYD
jgi:hypothetical protein